jgi:hypothetical protein
VIFYPESCLGGWVNPSHAQGKPETTSNTDESEFNADNSAILPKNTDAEMYCGNFRGTFDATTKPTKILVSLSLTKGADLLLQNTIVSDSFASSAQQILDTSSTTDLSFTFASTSVSSTTDQVPASDVIGTTTIGGTSADASSVSGSSTETSSELPVVSPSTPTSTLDNVIDVVKSSIDSLFNISLPQTPVQTDTVVVPPPQENNQEQTAPTSFNSKDSSIFSAFFEKVFAETTGEVEAATGSSATTQVLLIENTESGSNAVVASDTSLFATTSTSTMVDMQVVDATSTATSSIKQGNDDTMQNNFLEVLYTFDGITWNSLGTLNEISMKYRTFEIPLDATSTWNDMVQLQIKVVAKRHLDETPTVYLDAIKAEVMFQSTISHEHPDFARDTILKDEVVDGVRILTIINSDTNKEEIWYMQANDSLAEVHATTTLQNSSTTSTVISDATSTATSSNQFAHELFATSSIVIDSSSKELVTATSATNTEAIQIQKNQQVKPVWKKYQGDITTFDTVQDVLVAIKEQEKKEILIEEVDTLKVPDFAVDIIKRIKGIFLNKVLVQVERIVVSTSTDGSTTTYSIPELWLYDPNNSTQEKISIHGTTTSFVTVSNEYPIGVKGEYVLWLSSEKNIAYAYNVLTKEITQEDVPKYDPSRGERGEIHFADMPWKVIVGSEGFSFYSDVTGEVFSDEDSRLAEQLRHKVGLDAVLDKEELSGLNLPVEVDQK